MTLAYDQSFFFFSSRRRHTRLTCDWSSDVCSSDLSVLTLVWMPWAVFVMVTVAPGIAEPLGSLTVPAILPVTAAHTQARSEERRVGKECRSRWGSEHLKKKRKETQSSCVESSGT